MSKAMSNEQLRAKLSELEIRRMSADPKKAQLNYKLFKAAANNDYEIIFKLLQEGADPKATNNLSMTPLHYAQDDKSTELLELASFIYTIVEQQSSPEELEYSVEEIKEIQIAFQQACDYGLTTLAEKLMTALITGFTNDGAAFEVVSDEDNAKDATGTKYDLELEVYLPAGAGYGAGAGAEVSNNGVPPLGDDAALVDTVADLDIVPHLGDVE